MPPFQGGAAGLFSYDLGRSLERLPPPKSDEFGVPALAVGLYDVVVALDHVAGRAWIVSQGFPEVEPSRRRRRAAERLAEVRDWIAEAATGRLRLRNARDHRSRLCVAWPRSTPSRACRA